MTLQACTVEILNGKLYSLCSGLYGSDKYVDHHVTASYLKYCDLFSMSLYIFLILSIYRSNITKLKKKGSMVLKNSQASYIKG